MAFGGFERGAAPSQPMAEINVTPLVDVMLVLLVIFMIAAPLLASAIRLELPAEQAAAIGADGGVYWNAEAIDDATLTQRLQAAARRTPAPELHLRADRATRYERIARVMTAAQAAGLTRIGFVTDPRGAAPGR
jgi:biopolymer transport protein ExbD